MGKDILIRAAKTFVQAFLASLAAGVVGITDTSALKSLIVASLAAGLAAAWNAALVKR